ncbi:GNAT family N-acetyltransferase [Halobacterium jilantaiense]|uniref:Predicted N-acyltransferase, GNAT family n=1 Tax=Halobacterium jilantaiense TaxID=355548 RepID=A0A1I0MF51_9EURY|nr:GNAT family N-acetyltransferase [Halobacterium jilantaiense]SEV87005.1 Predicted N-acyltransferase, GNAT family [Halobacterium jilantaiense]
MRVERADTESEYEDALGVRYDVFVDEQGVPEDLEVDEYEETATHFVGYDDGEPVAAARLREYEPGVGKVERVAVRASRRGEGFGAAVMDAVEDAATGAFDELYLHAQLHVEEFYADRGYERDGEAFTEAGIEHVAMRTRL